MTLMTSCVLHAGKPHVVEIEASMSPSFGGLMLIGFPSEYTKDAKERIRAALEAIAVKLPARRIIVSAFPSAVLEETSTPLSELDLAVAAAVLICLKKFQPKQNLCLGGELTLKGYVREPSTPQRFLQVTQQAQQKSLTFYPIKRLGELMKSLVNLKNHAYQPKEQFLANDFLTNVQRAFDIFKHQQHVFFLLCLAAKSRQHLLLAGEPGIGKSFALKHLSLLFPPLDREQFQEVSLIHGGKELNHHVPIRNPHHATSFAGLMGGAHLKPGEVTLAHHGILLLDELAEFPRPTLESLREPIDNGYVSLTKSKGNITLPAKFVLAASTNLCPCGYVVSKRYMCRCTQNQINKYQQKLSGPLLDRIAIKAVIQLDSGLNDHPVIRRFFLKIHHQGIESLAQNLTSYQNPINNKHHTSLDRESSLQNYILTAMHSLTDFPATHEELLTICNYKRIVSLRNFF